MDELVVELDAELVESRVVGSMETTLSEDGTEGVA